MCLYFTDSDRCLKEMSTTLAMVSVWPLGGGECIAHGTVWKDTEGFRGEQCGADEGMIGKRYDYGVVVSEISLHGF